MIRHLVLLPLLVILPAHAAGGSGEPPATAKTPDALVAATHEASLAARQSALCKMVSRDHYWPDGAWGETIWSLSALHLNEKTELANRRLLERANEYVARQKPADKTVSTPGASKGAPWAYFAIQDYVRILYLFGAGSRHFPGRLEPETEAAMKEALWFWVKLDSKLANTTTKDLLHLLGTENHDLTRRPNHYLVASLLKDDPKFRDRPFDDGHTAAEHATAYTKFFRAWPRMRARTGLWFEVGSNTYQKYSWPALFNLHELAPDPLIRERFGLLLDLALIEEAQISVRGRRGGGLSRAGYGGHSFDSYKNLLYGVGESTRGATHSKVIETSRYQVPAAAILLRERTFPAPEPFAIRNRVLGELDAGQRHRDDGNRFVADSALVNYAWRTPHYLFGSTLQNPALSMPDPEGGPPLLKYGGITIQNRWCGMLFDDPSSEEVDAVYPVIEKTRGGRPQHPFWSVQHENVIILQRIAPKTRPHPMGSYSTGRVGIRFHGDSLRKVEEDGWIFADNGKAFIAVKFLDGGYTWNEDGSEASPAGFQNGTDTSRVLLHAGDITTHESLKQFKAMVRANRLGVEAGKVKYELEPGGDHVEAFSYDRKVPAEFELPRINGRPVELRPSMTYQSPYLNGAFGSDEISVTVGPVKRSFDFSK